MFPAWLRSTNAHAHTMLTAWARSASRAHVALRLEDPDVGQGPVALVEVQSVADHKEIRTLRRSSAAVTCLSRLLKIFHTALSTLCMHDNILRHAWYAPR